MATLEMDGEDYVLRMSQKEVRHLNAVLSTAADDMKRGDGMPYMPAKRWAIFLSVWKNAKIKVTKFIGDPTTVPHGLFED